LRKYFFLFALLPNLFSQNPLATGEEMGSYLLKNYKGQNLIEYAIVIALVSAAMVAMSTYIFRSVQAVQKQIDGELRN